jgi:alpha-glucosidase
LIEGEAMRVRVLFFVVLASLVAISTGARDCLASDGIKVSSPDGSAQFQVLLTEGRLECRATFKNKPVLESSPLRLSLDDVILTEGVELGNPDAYEVNETYPWRGIHSRAVNHCKGVRIPVKHVKSNTSYTLEARAFNDGVAFRYLVPANDKPRLPDEATTFVLPAGSTVWYHDLEGHYEGVHVKKDVDQIKAGEWVAPPMTFKLPDGGGYAAITEAALVHYAGMALQTEGQRCFGLRLGHSHPPSYPFRLRYGAEEAKRLSKPAAIDGAIVTPWRVVMIGPDLNALVNCDVVPNPCPPPDKKLFPQGMETDWIKPGRAVWRYLDGGKDTSLASMKELTKRAGELGFEHHVIEGFWTKWSEEELKDLVSYAKGQHVGIWLWKHSKSLRDPQARHDFLKRCHDLGVTGVKIDFFDHEAKEVIDLYESLLRETAEFKLLVNFHGANKPTGESRTWPNELTREAIKGMEASKLADRATHDATLPFTRLLAGPGDYTPVHFGERRRNTTWAHQVATGAIFGGPLLTYAAHPDNILANPCCEMVKNVPAVWDETVVLPPSEIGEVAVFARRSGNVWFLAILNGPTARTVRIPLSFLGKGDYRAQLVRDDPSNSAAVKLENVTLKSGASLAIDLREGGGFVGRFYKK